MTDKRQKLYDGDMVLDEYQISALSGSPNIAPAKAIRNESYRWPEGKVAYVIEESSANDRSIILEAMQIWEEMTCVRFTEMGDRESTSHLKFVKQGGCWSAVGMDQRTNGQDISIGRGCATKFVVAHEIAHALGFWHEHNRPDRDEYVAVLMHHVNTMRKNMFDRLLPDQINSFGLPYDYGSVMHYGRKSFSQLGSNTIVPKNALMNFVIGQRKRLSFLDVKLMNMMYTCDEACESKPECKNAGFVDQNCTCHCPDEFQGATCENPVMIPDPPCGGKHTVETIIDTGAITKAECAWVIQAPENQRVNIQFTKFDFTQRPPRSSSCWSHNYLEVRDGENFTGKEYCGDDLDGKTMTFSNEVALLCEVDSEEERRLTAKVIFV